MTNSGNHTLTEIRTTAEALRGVFARIEAQENTVQSLWDAAEEIVVGAAVLCRPRSRELEEVVPATVCLRECAGFVREFVRYDEIKLP